MGDPNLPDGAQGAVTQHGLVVALGPRVVAGAPITLASCEDGLLIATGAGDEEATPEEVELVCESCFTAERPEAARILQVARERGYWQAG